MRTRQLPNPALLLPAWPHWRLWVLTLASLVPALWLLFHDQLNNLVAVLFFAALLILTVVNKRLSILATLIYLFLLGDIRRVVGTLVGFPALDPLLLVGPGISAVLALPMFLRLRLQDSLSKAVFALMVVMALEIVNPRQGSIAVGVAGAMFYLVPLLWFWIGRQYGDDALLRMVIYRVVIPVGVLAAILGAVQTYIGFLPWEKVWIAAVADHYKALNLGNGFIRSFGFSVNSVEYIDLLLVASTCAAAAFFSGKRPYGLLVPALGAALFLASSRTALLRFLFAAAAAWALSSRGGRGWVTRLVVALSLGAGLLVFSIAHVSSSDGKAGQSSAASASAQHQLQGLSHPLDSRYSTAGLHSQMFSRGILAGFTNPIGNGLGSTTLASSKLGGDESAAGSSEVDISDAFISMGVIGGGIYLTVIVLIVRRALAFSTSAPRSVGLPAVGLLAALIGAWIALGQYAISPTVWLLIGILSRYHPGARLPGVKRTGERVRRGDANIPQLVS